MHYLDAVSTYAKDIDGLILLIAVLVGFWFFVAEGVLFWLVWKYRASKTLRAGYYTGAEKDVKRWITISHALVIICDIFIIAGAIRVWHDVKQELPPAERTVRVVGQQWAWTFVHPGADGELDTDDDIRTVDELHIEKDKLYHYELESRDVLHCFSVPVFRLKQDAVPGRVIKGWFEAIKTGSYDIQCAEMCGIGHGVMAARLSVETPQEHAAWIASKSD
jgi:cytochrome c oxidase subunit 2